MAQMASTRKEPLLSAEIESPAATPSPPTEDVFGNTVVGAGDDGPPPPPEGMREKKLGHKFFFFCCDVKRAVVWLNTVVLLLNLLTITAAAINVNPETEGYVRSMIVRSCGMFVTFTTLLGAYWYSKGIVLVGLVFACYQLTVGIMNLAKYNWGGENESGKLEVLFPVVWYTLMFYAEAVFIMEVNDGTMSAETYKRREKYSCCCNC